MKKYTIILLAALLLLALAAYTLPVSAASQGKIVFSSDRDGNFEIYTMNSDGSDLKSLTDNTANDEDPVWSSDGSKIVFSSNRDGNYEIYVMNADGTGQTRLTFNTVDDEDPAWSPDSSKIAFESYPYTIYVMNADGTDQTRLTPTTPPETSLIRDVDPTWSPDGSKIAFGNDDGIYMMDLDGIRTLVISNQDISAGIVRAMEPAWSPDGSKIAYTYDYGQTSPPFTSTDREIFIMNWDGTEAMDISNNPAYDREPDWCPDAIAPVTTYTLSGTLGENGWYVSEVVLTPSVTDEGGSGVKETTFYRVGGSMNAWIYFGTDPFTLFPISKYRITYWSVDNALNEEEHHTIEVNADIGKPDIQVTTPADGATYLQGQVVNANYAYTDTGNWWPPTPSLSGINEASLQASVLNGQPIDTSTPGTHTFTVSIKDNAGNLATKTVQYTVAYAYMPVTPSSTKITQVNLGSSMPVKVVLKDSSGNLITNAVVELYLAKQAGSGWGPEVAATSLSAPKDGNLFRYDSLKGQYVYNLNTKPLAQGTWQLRIKLSDGTTQTMTIQVVK
jgi:dipeptidyl aminopeptidase/acylaminoacyl peptidase